MTCNAQIFRFLQVSLLSWQTYDIIKLILIGRKIMQGEAEQYKFRRGQGFKEMPLLPSY